MRYESEYWRMTNADLNKPSSFHNKYLGRILQIFWPRKITNEELLERCKQNDMATIIARKRWRWIGHVMRREKDSIPRVAMFWTPEGKRRKGRPRTNWRRTVENEMKDMNKTWGSLAKMAQDRTEWKAFVDALNTTGCNRSNLLIACLQNRPYTVNNTET